MTAVDRRRPAMPWTKGLPYCREDEAMPDPLGRGCRLVHCEVCDGWWKFREVLHKEPEVEPPIRECIQCYGKRTGIIGREAENYYKERIGGKRNERVAEFNRWTASVPGSMAEKRAGFKRAWEAENRERRSWEAEDRHWREERREPEGRRWETNDRHRREGRRDTDDRHTREEAGGQRRNTEDRHRREGRRDTDDRHRREEAGGQRRDAEDRHRREGMGDEWERSDTEDRHRRERMWEPEGRRRDAEDRHGREGRWEPDGAEDGNR